MNTLIKITIAISFSLFSYLLSCYCLADDSACRRVQKKFQFPLLGLFFALVALTLYFFRSQQSTLQFILDNSFVYLLLAVAIIDLYSHYIYDVMLLLYSVINIVLFNWINGLQLKNGYGIITGFIFYGIIYVVTRLVYKREAFGLGDVLFLAAIGVVFDGLTTFAIGLLAFYVSVVHVLIQFVVDRALNRKSEIAFAPSIAVAGLLVYFYKAPLFATFVQLFWQ